MIRNKIDILIAKLSIWSIRKGYGTEPCETWDFEDFPELKTRPLPRHGCGNCRAQEIINWLEEHIKLIKM